MICMRSFNAADTQCVRSASHPLRTFGKMKRYFPDKATFVSEMGKERKKNEIKQGQSREIKDVACVWNRKHSKKASAGIQSHASIVVKGTLNSALISSPRCYF